MSDLSKVICCTPIGGTWSVSYHLAAWLAEQHEPYIDTDAPESDYADEIEALTGGLGEA
jgi:hypothetical protein